MTVYFYFQEVMSLESWQTRSFLFELKPRSELASFFVDCPLPGDNETDCCHNQQIQDETAER